MLVYLLKFDLETIDSLYIFIIPTNYEILNRIIAL